MRHTAADAMMTSLQGRWLTEGKVRYGAVMLDTGVETTRPKGRDSAGL